MSVEDISEAYKGGEHNNSTAQQERHDIWLSHLPDRVTLLDAHKDSLAVYDATLRAVVDCTKTVGSSDLFLSDPDFCDKVNKPLPTDFNDSVFKSLPKSIQHKMEPSDESILSETALIASIFLAVDHGNFEDKRQEVEKELKEGLGQDDSNFRTTTIQHILLHHFTGGRNVALDEVSKNTWNVDESILLHKTALDNIQQKTASK